MSNDFNEVEITVRFIGDDYKTSRDVYMQRVNYDWMFNNRPMLLQQVVAVVNNLDLPPLVSVPPGSFMEVK